MNFTSASSLKDCRKTLYKLLNKKNEFKISLSNFESNLHPTQFQVGKIVIKNKVKKILQMDLDTFQKYLDTKPIPFVLGPDGKYWMVDRHHTSLAILETRGLLARMNPDFLETDITLTILEDLSHLSRSRFLKRMRKNYYIYSRRNGEDISPTLLPTKLSNLSNDHFRSLGWLLRNAGVFEKVPKPFLEFNWGDYLRGKMTIPKPGITQNHLIEAFEIIFENEKEISKLPGYISRPYTMMDSRAKENLLRKMLYATVEYL